MNGACESLASKDGSIGVKDVAGLLLTIFPSVPRKGKANMYRVRFVVVIIMILAAAGSRVLNLASWGFA